MTTKIELQRLELTEQLTETLGPDTAKTLMAHIPSINVEQVATKDDLKTLENCLRTDMAAGFTEVHAKIDTGLAEVNTKIDTGLAEVNTKIDTGLAEVRSEIADGFARLMKGAVFMGLGFALPVWFGLIVLLISIATGQLGN